MYISYRNQVLQIRADVYDVMIKQIVFIIMGEVALPISVHVLISIMGAIMTKKRIIEIFFALVCNPVLHHVLLN